MILKRDQFLESGIFGTLSTEEGLEICSTLEHAFASPDYLTFSPKMPAGQYVCVRGEHRLKHGDPFETFEITQVPGHTGILFHVGNYNRDSDGCVLVGELIVRKMIIQSTRAFRTFLRHTKGLGSFDLTVL